MSVCSLSPGRMETDAFSMSGRRTGLRIFPISKGVQKCYTFKKGAGTIDNLFGIQDFFEIGKEKEGGWNCLKQ